MPITQDRYDRLRQRFDVSIEGDVGEPRYHLFHAAGSICSQKVRATLLESGTAFHSHELNMFVGENYQADYVRTRAEECARRGLALAATHDGGSSVADYGCDACVVPTIVDATTRDVMVDSVHICRELAERLVPSLYPPHLKADIEREMALVDRLQNYGILAPKLAAKTQKSTGTGFYETKLAYCERGIAENPDDDLLVRAYSAKRKKEQTAIDTLLTEEQIAAAHRDMEKALRQLSERLPDGDTFLFSDTLTLADIFWATELIRADDVGHVDWITAHPRLERYYQRLLAAPAIRKAIVDWSGARFNFSDIGT